MISPSAKSTYASAMTKAYTKENIHAKTQYPTPPKGGERRRSDVQRRKSGTFSSPVGGASSLFTRNADEMAAFRG